MTFQRQRGIPATIYRAIEQEDSRGNKQFSIVEDDPHHVKVWTFPQRGARAEVPGQQHIDVTRLGTTADLTDVSIWSQLDWRGKRWDVVSPPAYHHGSSRHVRHWSFDVRERP